MWTVENNEFCHHLGVVNRKQPRYGPTPVMANEATSVVTLEEMKHEWKNLEVNSNVKTKQQSLWLKSEANIVSSSRENLMALVDAVCRLLSYIFQDVSGVLWTLVGLNWMCLQLILLCPSHNIFSTRVHFELQNTCWQMQWSFCQMSSFKSEK